MFEKQSKNTTKIILAVLVSVIFGEGVLGLGVFWPSLFLLLDWKGVYWLSFVIGVLMAVIYQAPIGLMSLYLIVVCGVLSLYFGFRKEFSGVVVFAALVANFVFDKIFGLDWSYLEAALIVVTWVLVMRWQERQDAIKISY